MVVILFLSIPHNILQDFLTFRVILLCFPQNAFFFLYEMETRKTKLRICDYFITAEAEQQHFRIFGAGLPEAPGVDP